MTLTPSEARQRLNAAAQERVLIFDGAFLRYLFLQSYVFNIKCIFI